MNMDTITIGKLTDKIATLANIMLDALNKGEIRKAEDTADSIARMLYSFRKLNEDLQVESNK